MANSSMPAPTWIGDLTSSLHSLKIAADRARTSYDSASTAAESLRGEANHADANTHDLTLYTTKINCEGYERTQYPSVLAEIAFAHGGLAMSLSRVWHRAAAAYAYGLTQASHDIERGRTPHQAAIRQDSAIPQPPEEDEELFAAYLHAIRQELAIGESDEPYGALCWAGCAEAWQAYSAILDRRVWGQLIAAASSSSR
ncbi:hypothetical protein [Streptomyces sp. NEAU-S7GS2]|uniref:hypothetical protein n=1 Tax=Streptomyces sp. NEAU-S7GS2 TaxID=2202000 RepID=UPI000D6EC354|nr:hypothetical protein [Streptomyces sp. NEAU-S7GS2]AWN32607.1 hypothetical protein DKG71_42260 [Streptomyces sp. NEAU-S7GS2]